MRRWSIPWRTIAWTLGLLAATGWAQVARVDRALPGHHRAVVEAVAGPLLASGAWMALVVTLVTRMRVRALLRALAQVAAGNFQAKLPVPRESVLRAVNDAFTRTNEALARLTDRLAFADAQRRRLFSDLAHELATPSTAILGLVDTLGSEALVPTAAERAALHAVLEREALRLARLVGDVRDLAMMDDPDVVFAREPADMADLAASAIERFRVVSPGGAAITLRASRAWAPVDAARIEQALVNLLRNAKRYAPAGGVIEVEAAPDGAWVRLVVEDGGPPLPNEIIARLGERLFRGDPARSAETGGAGLGLAIVRSIVHRHGGTIDFARGGARGQGGLRVTVRLPGCEEPGGMVGARPL
jgi:two-component system, OmpR family, sensor histidine kinase BaeS